MALPMVSLAVIVMVVPLVFRRIYPTPGLDSASLLSIGLIITSGAVGSLTGTLIPLDKFWSRSVIKPLRMMQDLLANDFYTENFYRSTIVAFVAFIAKVTDVFDRQVINRFVNSIGSASMISAEGLRLAVSGQMQSYVLTILSAIILLILGLVLWSGT